MRLLCAVLLVGVLCGCNGPDHVSASDFKRQYASVSTPGTMRDYVYLGQRDGRAYIRVSSMSLVNKHKWSDRVIYVELSELDPVFRETLPKTEMKDVK